MSRNGHKRYDAGQVKDAAAGRWDAIILAVCPGVPSDRLDGNHGPCLRRDCGGTDRFRVFGDFKETGGAFCNQCGQNIGDGLAFIQWFTGCSFSDAVEKVASHLGLKPSTNGRKPKQSKADPAANLEFLDWNDALAWQWCRHKPPIEFDVVRAVGGRRARYRNQYVVIAIPIWGQLLTEDDPVGWVLFPLNGKTLPKYSKEKDAKPEWVRVKVTYGSQPGIVGPVEQLEKATRIWKVEGVSDCLALNQVLPPGEIAVANSCGAKERPPEWFLDYFADKDAIVVHDCDKPGQDGAVGWSDERGRFRPGWAPLIASRSASCRNVILPYEVIDDHGKDLRDFLNDGNGFLELQTLANKSAEVTPPDSVESGQEVTGLGFDGPELTDRGNAKRFADAFGSEIRFCTEWESYIAYEGGRWRRNAFDAVKRRALTICDLIIKEIPSVKDHGIQEAMLKFAHRTQSTRAIRDMLYLVDALVPVSVREIDSNPMLFNCANGTIDLETGKLKNHDPDDYITLISEFPFDPEAKCPTWDACLKTITNGDQDIQDYLWKFFGYCLTGDTREHRLPIFHGEGRNGKSTILKAVMAAIGEDYATKVARDLLIVKRNQGHPTGLCDLFGRRLAVAIETGEWERLDEPIVKELTGGDKIKARRVFENYWDFDPTHKIVICTNHKPRVTGRDHAIWSRLDLVPFDVRFWDPQKGETGRPEFRIDRTVDTRLANELPGILAWLVRGCIAWRKEGLPQPEAIRVATEKFRDSQSDIPVFIRECCIQSPDEIFPSEKLRKAYNAWRSKDLSGHAFRQKMESAGFKCEKSTSGKYKDLMCWQGLTLQQEFMEFANPERRTEEDFPRGSIGEGVYREGTGNSSAVLRSEDDGDDSEGVRI